MDNIDYLQDKLSHFELKYPNRPLYCSLRMIGASIASLFIKNSKKIKDKIIIVFDIKGELGDAIIASNFIYNLYIYLKDSNITFILYYPNKEVLASIFTGLPKQILLTNNKKQTFNTLKIELNRFPKVSLEIKTKNLRLNNLLESWHKFFIYNRKFFSLSSQIDTLANDYTEILEGKRINQADIGGILGLTEKFTYKIPIQNEEKTLKKLNLENSKFITIQRSVSASYNNSTNNKLWPKEYYQDLIYKLKELFPNYKFVQIGANNKNFNTNFTGIDKNLQGKTSLEEIKVILKHSSLHIDIEGGLVHLRHALNGGPSIVLFGPTSQNIYGYSENLNLRTNACRKPCEWITNDWMTHCPRKIDKNICMKSLTPDFVFNEIKNFIEQKNILI